MQTIRHPSPLPPDPVVVRAGSPLPTNRRAVHNGSPLPPDPVLGSVQTPLARLARFSLIRERRKE
jgi:hypothetical protein